MLTETVCGEDVFALLVGSSTLSAFGLTIVDTMMKKINNRNTISVMDDMLNVTLTLFLDLSPIITRVREVDP